jgi:hypothetical protein
MLKNELVLKRFGGDKGSAPAAGRNLPGSSGLGFPQREKEKLMSIEQQGMNDAQQNKGMTINPLWTSAEKEKYAAAYNGAKKK